VIGQPLVLKTKSRFISAETEQKVTIGSLPDDISRRLSKLISTGNKYQCLVHSSSHNSCLVYIREIFVASGNEGRLPFPPVKSLSSADLGDEWFIENNLPIDTGEESDDPSEKKLSFSAADISDEDDK